MLFRQVLNDVTGARRELEALLEATTIKRLLGLPKLVNPEGNVGGETGEELAVASVLVRRCVARASLDSVWQQVACLLLFVGVRWSL